MDGRARACTVTGQLDFRQNCDSYQLVKSLYAIANGGYGGTGLGQGTFTTVDGIELIPHLNTDFIYSALAQELGLIGAAALLCLYMVFVARGMRVALVAQDGFSKLLAAGLTFGFALQTFIIVGGVLRVVPLTGITLPFVSYGGSSILANFVMLALLLLVSNRANAHGSRAIERLIASRGRPRLLASSSLRPTGRRGRAALAEARTTPIQRVVEFSSRADIPPAALLARNRAVEKDGAAPTSPLPWAH